MSKEVAVWDYLNVLKKHKVYRNKHLKFISHIAIYTKELNVYKVIVWADTNKLRWKEHGLKDAIKIYDKNNNDKNLPFPKLKKELEGSEIGNKMFIYTPKNDSMNCFEGEDTIDDYTEII